ncbi:MAG: pantetheine-phosphate adenylyltransferase [Clostridiales bacterium]|jgi:pantetheine-phosphate adenylyltransferase|nr:pantetheine-phosphate adenylyltransferase [Clostridiales bacterium]
MIAIYPGSFDPPTLGHLDIIRRSLNIFEKIIIALPEKSFNKNLLFNSESRIKMLNLMIQETSTVQIELFDCLLVDFARKKNVKTIIRGIRDTKNFIDENYMQHANKNLCGKKEIETIFLISDIKYCYITSSLVKEILTYKHDSNLLKKFLHPEVINYLKHKNQIPKLFL